MATTPFRLFVLTVASALSLAVFTPAAWAEDEPSDSQPDSGSEVSTLTDRLMAAAEAGITDPAAIADELSLPATGPSSLNLDDTGKVLVNVMFDGPPSETLIAEIKAIGEIDKMTTFVQAASVRTNPAHLKVLLELEGVTSVTPALQPFTGRSTEQHTAKTPIALTAPTDSCRSLPVEADSPLRTDLARELFGVDGTGLTIGVISDSFGLHDIPTSWQDDVAAGALPGPENPCGYLTPVEIHSDADDPASASDEGRAMAQLVHGIAPGAKIIFSDAGSGDVVMAENIYALAQAGADIIVDDITWPTEAYFQKSFISVAIEMAKNDFGVAYFTSAGNSTGVGRVGASAGVPLSSWQTTAFRPMPCPSWVSVDTSAPFDCLDFDPSSAQVAFDTLSIDENGSLGVLASIGEPIGNVTTSYEAQFYLQDANPANDPTKIGSGIPSIGSNLPGLAGAVDVEAGTKVRMVVVRTGYDPAAPLPAFYIGFVRGGDTIAERTFLGDGVTDVVGRTTFGHGGNGSGISVASLHWDDPTRVRNYSSLGPNTLLFEPVSLTSLEPSAPLPEPVIVDAPHIAAVDGVQTTFFGNPLSGYRFYGTSAAAPIAAATFALAKQYAPGFANDELSALMLSATRANHVRTGTPTNPYEAVGIASSSVFGAGLIDIIGTLELLPTRGFGEPDTYDSTADSITITWSGQVGATDFFVLELYDEGAGASASGGGAAFTTFSGSGTLVQSATLPSATTSHTFTGLQPNRAYSVVLNTHFAGGAVTTSGPLHLTTRPAAPPAPPVPPVNPGDSGVPTAHDQIARTGGADITVTMMLVAALLILGAATLAVSGTRARVARPALSAHSARPAQAREHS